MPAAGGASCAGRKGLDAVGRTGLVGATVGQVVAQVVARQPDQRRGCHHPRILPAESAAECRQPRRRRQARAAARRPPSRGAAGQNAGPTTAGCAVPSPSHALRVAAQASAAADMAPRHRRSAAVGRPRVPRRRPSGDWPMQAGSWRSVVTACYPYHAPVMAELYTQREGGTPGTGQYMTTALAAARRCRRPPVAPLPGG